MMTADTSRGTGGQFQSAPAFRFGRESASLGMAPGEWSVQWSLRRNCSLAPAQLLKFYFPGALLVKDARADATVDVVLGQQFTKVESSAAVQKAITTPVAVTTGNCKPAASSGSPKPSGS